MNDKLYADRHPMELEPHYCKHVSAMTAEALHSKADIAAELAYRDKEIERLHADAENLHALIRQFDAGIHRIATALTGKACGGVDTGGEINPETGEPYGPGGHTGWLLAITAERLQQDLRSANDTITSLRNDLSASNALVNEWVGKWEGGQRELAQVQAVINRTHTDHLPDPLDERSEICECPSCQFKRASNFDSAGIGFHHNLSTETSMEGWKQQAIKSERQVIELSAKVAVMDKLCADLMQRMDTARNILFKPKIANWGSLDTKLDRETLSNLPEQSLKLLAVVEAAERVSESDDNGTLGMRLMKLRETVRALQGDKHGEG